MAQYEVTGVRYQMGEGLTWEEITLKAEDFIRQLKDGTPLILAAEPDNPRDSKAIAVYMDYTRRLDREAGALPLAETQIVTK